MLAAVLIRGRINTRTPIRDTLNMLKLVRKNTCVLVKDTATMKGMLVKVKDYITFGEIDEETIKILSEKRSQKTKDRNGKEITKPFFRLHPPRGGFERKGIKKTFKVGGALGYRGSKINELIKRMI